MSHALDEFRFGTLHNLARIPSFQKAWPTYRAAIVEILGDNPTGQDVFRLGDRLSDIFRANFAERSQSGVSAGGTNWECLVSWYLNFVCYGTGLVAAKRTRKNTPRVLSDSISVTLHGYSATTEADVLVYSVPGIETSRIENLTVEDVNQLIEIDTNACSVAVVQCKTNWNDNAQIPMLWDMIYRSLTFVEAASVRIGQNGVNPKSFRNTSIKYAFMTVPTTSRDKIKAGGVAVTRVSGLSGGNYWGYPTKDGVAAGFSDFLNCNFPEFFTGSIPNHITRQMASRPDLLKRFVDLDFSNRKPEGQPRSSALELNIPDSYAEVNRAVVDSVEAALPTPGSAAGS